MEKQIKVEDLSRKQLENIARLVLDTNKLKELISGAINKTTEKNKLIGISEVK